MANLLLSAIRFSGATSGGRKCRKARLVVAHIVVGGLSRTRPTTAFARSGRNTTECDPRHRLAGLKNLGLDLAIDDFGTGYSSLSYLKRFPFDAVKIDRAFVDGLGTDRHDTALVAAIVAMAGALGLEITAEGVETNEQLSCLKELGVPRVQGFYLAEPMPGADSSRLIRETHRWKVD